MSGCSVAQCFPLGHLSRSLFEDPVMSGNPVQDTAPGAAARYEAQHLVTTFEAPRQEVNGRFARGKPAGPGGRFARPTAARCKVFCAAVSQRQTRAQVCRRRACGGGELETLDLQEVQPDEEEVRHYGSLPSVPPTPYLGMACHHRPRLLARHRRPRCPGPRTCPSPPRIPGHSVFACAEEVECQEVTGCDNRPSPNGSIGGAETSQTPLLPNAETPPQAGRSCCW
jgi:hypothetical protein